MKSPSLAIVVTHPIQYQAPWFRAITARGDVDLTVLFCKDATPLEQAEAGFGVRFRWDRPLFDGYNYRFLANEPRRSSPGRPLKVYDSEVWSIVRSGEFDAVLVHGWHYRTAWQAFLACRVSGVPVLVRGDSHLHSPRTFARTALKWPLYRTVIPHFDACLPVGIWSREYFSHYGARPNRIFEVPHSVDVRWFGQEADRLRPERRSLRARWTLNEDDVVFLFAGKFIPKKRPLDFARAIGTAARTGARVVGLMVGDGPLRPETEAYVRSTNAPVRFAGFLNQSAMPAAYAASDMLLLPSEGDETWGLVVDEAMSSGLPCLVSDRVGCGPDLIHPEETGEVVPLGDVDGLATRLVANAQDVPHLVDMGLQARERIQSRSPEAAAERLVLALHAVTTRSGSRSPRRT